MKIKGDTAFGLVLLLVFAFGLVLSVGFPSKARLLPLFLMSGGVILSIWLLITGLRQTPRAMDEDKTEDNAESPVDEEEGETVTAESERTIILWIGAFAVMIMVVGFWVTMAVYVPIFMRGFGKETWITAAVFTVAMWGLVYGVFHLGLSIPLYGGLLGLSFL